MPKNNLLLITSFLAFISCPAGDATATSNENVLMILADDLGVDFVGGYGEGSDPAPTPTIDSLMTSGLYFRNAWANPRSPSRPSQPRQASAGVN